MLGVHPLAQGLVAPVPSTSVAAKASTPCTWAKPNRCAMITRSGALPLMAPVHHQQSLPATRTILRSRRGHRVGIRDRRVEER